LDTVPVLAPQHQLEPRRPIVGVEPPELILDRVARRQVADVMQEGAESNESSLGVCQLAVESPFPGKLGRAGLDTRVPFQSLDHHLNDRSGPEGVLEASVRGTSIDEAGLTQLIDAAKVLERWVIHNRQLVFGEADEPMNRNEELL
ncbi:MAG TPA: hypothetical protein VKR30_10560, partial [Candidatus Limnocylindrales bacterium]|nr:hypothetical protein [Candidatus Limnocylindrales bacterium]